MLEKAWNNLLRVGGLVDGATLIHPTRLKLLHHSLSNGEVVSRVAGLVEGFDSIVFRAENHSPWHHSDHHRRNPKRNNTPADG